MNREHGDDAANVNQCNKMRAMLGVFLDNPDGGPDSGGKKRLRAESARACDPPPSFPSPSPLSDLCQFKKVNEGEGGPEAGKGWRLVPC